VKLSRLSVLVLLVSTSFAIFHTAWHDAGLLTVKLSNYGTFGNENAGIWPRGTNESYIFGAGIWVGGLKPDTLGTALTADVDSLDSVLPVGSTAGFDTVRGVLKLGAELVYYRHASDTSFDSCVRGFAGSTPTPHLTDDSVQNMRPLVSVGYDPSTGNSEFAPGDLPNEPGYDDTLDRIFFSDNPDDTAHWPLRDSLGRKIVVSNQDSYNASNDSDPGRHSAGGAPLDIKVIQRGFAWYYHYYEDFIFLTYLIVNNSQTDTLRHVFAGVCCDADIGDATDDLVGSDASRDLGYAWDSNFNEPGWMHTPGYIGFDFLESPVVQDSQLGLTAFKILHNPSGSGPGVPDPANDLEAYLTVAGYDHPTGLYHPFDSISEAADIRFVQCTGAFDLAPQDTGRVVIAVTYGADSTDLRGNSDLAQRLYDGHFITHKAWVDDPNGGEEISGTYTIRWRDSSASGLPLLADIGCSHDRGKTWQDIVTNIPSTGSYDWNTQGYRDGTRYLVRVTVHDAIAVGEDVSDSVFTVNNPGNGAPDLEYLSPHSGTIRGTGTIRWDADDPDGDTLSISLYIGTDTNNWTEFASGIPDTGRYNFNSYPFPNGAHYLMVKASDRDTFTTARSGATVEIMNDHRPAGEVTHVRGGCNSMNLLALDFDSTQYTGHTYEISFEPIQRQTGRTEPLYQYNLRDITADSLLLGPIGLNLVTDGQLYSQYSPITDGFALEFGTRIDKSAFRFVDYYQQRNRSGFDGDLSIYGEDSLGIAPPLLGYEWCFRGSDYVIRWKRESPPDSLTIEVYDSTNQSFVAYNRTRGDCWQFGSGSQVGQYYRQSVHKVFYLDGGLFWFNKNNEMTIPPDSGDIWVIRSAGPKVPCAGNVYRFATPEGIAEGSSLLVTRLTRIAPNPIRSTATISYSLSRKQRTAVSLYDVSGRRLKTLVQGIQTPGRYSLAWDGTDDKGRLLSAGVYFVKLETAEARSVKKAALVR
jgi:hypothetical protein